MASQSLASFVLAVLVDSPRDAAKGKGNLQVAYIQLFSAIRREMLWVG